MSLLFIPISYGMKKISQPLFVFLIGAVIGSGFMIFFSSDYKSSFLQVVYAKTTNPNWIQFHFRFREDDNSESAATWIASEDTNIISWIKNITFRIRLMTRESAGQNQNVAITPLLEYKTPGACVDTSGWTTIDTSCATNVFCLVLSSQFVDKDATTAQLSGQGGHDFVAGEILETSNPASADTTLSKSVTEHEWSVQANSNAGDGTAYILRLSDGVNNADYNSYSVCPQVTTNAVPSAPSQTLPTDTDTDISVTPNFTMTATDSESDDLGYKVTIYSASGCSASLVSTHDQSVTATGWASTDASCTNNPTSCYASGTQGDFTLQAGDELSEETQYWWRASAQDPDGTGTFTDSATCYTFTTGGGNNIPTVSAVDLNASSAITLTENTTTSIDCTGTGTDQDSGSDITSSSGVIYRSGVSGGASCSADDNNCYIIAICSLGAPSGNNRSVTCNANIQFFAEPTDSGAYSAETWQCEVTVTDSQSASGSNTDSTPPELNTLLALNVTSSVNYGGPINPTTDTGVTNQTVTVTNTGNASQDTEISGDVMCLTSFPSCPSDSFVPGQQRYGFSDVTYASLTYPLSATTSPNTIQTNLAKPTSATPVTIDTYWGIAIPDGQVSGSYTGQNTFTAVTDI